MDEAERRRYLELRDMAWGPPEVGETLVTVMLNDRSEHTAQMWLRCSPPRWQAVREFAKFWENWVTQS
jgi:hypothetical protein